MNRLYPIFLKLEGRLCAVVGGGSVAARKAEALLECGARLRVIAPEAAEEVEAWSVEGKVEWRRRAFQPGDLEGACLVVASSDDEEANRAVFDEARRLGVPCNVVDVPELCDFFVPSTVRRGDVKVSISTNGQSPALAAALRRKLEADLPADLAEWVEEAGRLREKVRQACPDDSRKRMQMMKELTRADELLDALAREDQAQLEAIRESWKSYLSD